MSMVLKNIGDKINTGEDFDNIKMFFQINNINYFSTKEKKSYLSLMIRFYIKYYDYNIYNELISTLIENHKLMKRDYLLFAVNIYKYNLNKSKHIFYKYIILRESIQNKDIDCLIDNQCHELIKLLDKYYVCCNKNENITDDTILYKNFLSDDIKNKILDFYKNKIQDYDKFIERLNNIDCIIDGGNISHIDKGICNYKYFKKVYDMILLKFNNPLVIIHKRHRKSLKKIYPELINNINIYYTPFHEYDDYYIIVALIYSGKYIISNDIFRDHIFDMFKLFDTKDNKIRNYILENIISYNKDKIKKINTYSKCIQVISDKIYIPTKNGFFLYT